MKRGRFAERVLERLGAPHSRHNRCAFQTWMQVEHAIGDDSQEPANNPLSTTLRLGGSTDFNDLGGGIAVQNYTTARNGIEASVRTLHQANFTEIRNRLQYNAIPSLTLQAIADSDWGSDGPLLARVLPDVQRELEKYERHSIGKWTA